MANDLYVNLLSLKYVGCFVPENQPTYDSPECIQARGDIALVDLGYGLENADIEESIAAALALPDCTFTAADVEQARQQGQRQREKNLNKK